MKHPLTLKPNQLGPVLKATVYPVAQATPNRIVIVARPRGNDWLCEEIGALSREGIDILVSLLTDAEAEELGLNDESAEYAAAGISFVNVPIPDRLVPSDTNAFLRNVEELATRVREGHYVAVHCRASIGRSSVLAASRTGNGVARGILIAYCALKLMSAAVAKHFWRSASPRE